LTGAGAVLGWGWVLPRLEPSPAIRGGALLLFALAPFPVFLAGSHMNHTPALLWLLLAAGALLRLDPVEPRPALGFAAGLALGLAAATRPPDALALALPGAAWTLWRLRGSKRLGAVVLAGLAGLALPIAGLLALNLATTGSALRFAYEYLWGKNV